MTTNLSTTGPNTPFLTRSWLVMPPCEDASLRAGARSGTDVLVADLSTLDPPARSRGADRILSFLKGRAETARRNDGSPALFVLLPTLDDETSELLDRITAGRPEGFALSGIVESADLQHLDVLLSVQEAINGWSQGEIRTAAFVADAPRHPLAGVSHRLAAIGWSAEETSRMLGTTRMHDSAGELTDAFRQTRSNILLAGAKAGLDVIDTVSGIFSTERLARDCREAAADGFTGKAALLPRQVSTLNHTFSPSTEAVAQARSLLQAPEKLDAQTARRAWQVVQRSEP